MKEQTVMFFGMSLNTPPQPVVGTCHNEGAKIRFGSHEIEVLHTPGHSKGSVCYYIKNERTLLSGDTLFAGSMGRTDLEGGDNAEMMQSLLRLSELPEDTKVYPGHGPATNIENEKRWIQAVCRR
jgi:glyoxylase-like metal-dependent hydrolase (beta-lactamase superfamily II)